MILDMKCGCKIDTETIHPYRISLNCPMVFEMLSRGDTKGVFQLESPLGRTYSKKLRPTELKDLLALVALLRPGVLEAYDENGTNMVQKYCNRKNFEEEITYLHPILEPLLRENFGVLVFQETCMAICQLIAGFTDGESDSLRRAMGKKLPEEMSKVKALFLEKAAALKLVPQDIAENLFEQIQASQRYNFNASHACSYGTYSYITAYFKSHFPDIFFCSYLTYASEKIDPMQEKSDLVNEAKKFNIDVKCPDLRFLKPNFHIHDGHIYFGLGNVKGVGTSKVKKLIKICQDKPLSDMSYFDLLLEVFDYVDITTVENLIKVGALDYLGESRTRLLFHYSNIWCRLTDKEREWIRTNRAADLETSLVNLGRPKAEGGGCANKNRVAEIQDLLKIYRNNPFTLDDTPIKIAKDEEELLGISLTYHEVDSCDTSRVTCSCKDFLSGYAGDIVLGVKLTRVNEIKTKKGKNPGQLMSFLTGEDASGTCDSIVCFPDQYSLYKNLLSTGNTVLIYGNRSKDNSLIVKQVDQM